MTNRKLLTIGGAGALAALLAGGLVSAYAEDTGIPGVIPAQDSGTTDDDRAAEREVFLQKVADRLGVSIDALQEALQGASLDAVDEKLASGEITEERAAELREQIEAGDYLFGFGGPGGGHGRHRPGLGVSRDELAAFLGIEETALHEALHAGSTLAEVASANGTSRDELKAFINGQATEAINQAVTAGRITQEQADEKLASLAENLDTIVDGQFIGGFHGGRTGPSGTTTDGASFSYLSAAGSSPY